MLVSRSLGLGLVVLAVALLVGTILEKARRPAGDPAPLAAPAVTVVDVARGVDVSELGTLVKLQADERVVTVGDRPVSNDFAAASAIANHAPGAGRFLDLTVASTRGSRRVLVLMH
ncbi:MAG TPA: hypothetical protein VK427_03440 [Kofleriaceae bacterium]|nr:hypothetical protein [Kofleriaceae bacterium]